MRVAINTRVSTDKQECENQVVQLREFAAKQGWEILHEYTDVASGGKSDRDGLKAMFNDASQRQFDLLLFWALDRLSREGVLETLRYLERLTSYGVGYRSFTEQFFDSCGVFKDAIVAIMATLAKQERVKRSERTRAGLAIARNRGKRLGRPAKTVSTGQIFALRSGGASLRAIGKITGDHGGQHLPDGVSNKRLQIGCCKCLFLRVRWTVCIGVKKTNVKFTKKVPNPHGLNCSICSTRWVASCALPNDVLRETAFEEIGARAAKLSSTTPPQLDA